MKKYNLMIEILIAVLFGIIGGALFVAGFEKKLPTQGVGSLADWVSGIATVLALIFAYAEIRNSREQFEKEHKPELMVYTGWKDTLFLTKSNDDRSMLDLSGVKLHIVPVNKGLATGIYRYLGICRKEDLKRICDLADKAKDNNINGAEIDEFAKLIYFDLVDIWQNAKNYDRTGMSLLYPNDNKLFQTIDSIMWGKLLIKRGLR